ncbi:MAG: preprotein translocase subunit SecE [Clostridia bacterium]|nr:preprotein translocase subunit SecE [Clostridia bacterium]
MEDNKKLTADLSANSKAKEIKATEKKKNNKNKKPGFFAKIGKKIKEMWSELKLVSWPTFPKVLKQTGIVIVVVLVFLVCIALFDWPLTVLLTKITGN